MSVCAWLSAAAKCFYQPQAYVQIMVDQRRGKPIFTSRLVRQSFYALRAAWIFHKVCTWTQRNYRFLSTRALETADESDLDSVTFGAIVRFDL
jgi:hypothetical protein